MPGILISLAAIPVPWVFILTYLTGVAAQLVLPMTIHSRDVSRIMLVAGLVAGTRVEIWPLIVLPLLLAYVNFVVIPVEERGLRDVFGDAYQQYCVRVRRWL